MGQFYSCAMPVGVHVLPKLDLESRLEDALGTSKSTHCIPRLWQVHRLFSTCAPKLWARARARASISAWPLHTVCAAAFAAMHKFVVHTAFTQHAPLPRLCDAAVPAATV